MKREYASKNWNLESLKKIDLQEVGGYYSIAVERLTEKAIKDYGFDDSEEYVSLSQEDMYNDEIVKDSNSIDYDSYYFDEYEWEDTISSLMNNKYNHYLVVLYNCTWTGANGIKIFDDYYDCFKRSYDCSMYYVKSSAKGKVLELRESHHDVPTGHKSMIIGLTDTEYERLDNMGGTEQFKFARKYELN